MRNYLLPFIATNLLLVNSVSVIAFEPSQILFLSQKNNISCHPIAKVQNIAGQVILNRPDQKEKSLQKNDFLCSNDQVKIEPKATLTFICNDNNKLITSLLENKEIMLKISELCKERCAVYFKGQGCIRGGYEIAQDTGKPNIIFPKNDNSIPYNTQFIIKWDNVEGAIKYIVRIKILNNEIWHSEETSNNQIEFPTNLPLESNQPYVLIVEAIKSDNSKITAEKDIIFQ